MRLAPCDGSLIGTLRPWLEAALRMGIALPPLGMLADLGLLLRGAPLSISGLDLGFDTTAYEDQLLARLAGDRLLERARDAIGALNEERSTAPMHSSKR